MGCAHEDFEVIAQVNRLEDTKQFMADIRLRCTRCGLPFRFLGLPMGLDLSGARVSVDGLEARLAVAPSDQVSSPLAQASGFGVRAQ